MAGEIIWCKFMESTKWRKESFWVVNRAPTMTTLFISEDGRVPQALWTRARIPFCYPHPQPQCPNRMRFFKLKSEDEGTYYWLNSKRLDFAATAPEEEPLHWKRLEETARLGAPTAGAEEERGRIQIRVTKALYYTQVKPRMAMGRADGKRRPDGGNRRRSWGFWGVRKMTDGTEHY